MKKEPCKNQPRLTNPDPEKDKVLISVLNYMLTRGHYVQKELNDEFSEMVFNRSFWYWYELYRIRDYLATCCWDINSEITIVIW